MKISYPYLETLSAGDPPRPAEVHAIIHKEVESEGQRTTTFVSKMLDIRKMIRALMASRDIPQDSHLYCTPQQIKRNTHFFHQYGDSVI
jgi:hypothetical protein